jgi:copper chaperone CopZ
MQKESVNVVGLTSEGCIDRIVHALRGVAGVHDVVVSLLRSRVIVEFDETRIARSQIDRVLFNTGYLIS